LKSEVLAEQIPLPLWLMPGDSTEIFFNSVSSKILGKFQTGDDVFNEIVHPEDLSHFMARYQVLRADHLPFEIEHRLRRSNGEYFWVLHRGFPVIEDGKVAFYMGIFDDRSAEKQREDRIMSLVSHDLTAPLRAITSFSELLKEKIQRTIPPDCQEYLDILTKTSEDMRKRIATTIEFLRSKKRE
jgi:PAS domain S-box-containing protein